MKKILSLLTLLIVFSMTSLAQAAQTCIPNQENIPKNIDLQKVRAAWLSWVNEERSKLKLTPYELNSQLNRTATIWSEQAKKKGKIDHKRPGQSTYYDFKKVNAWFATLGLKFKNIGGYTTSENIAWDYYKCADTTPDCTDAFLKAARRSFDFYMREKNKSYRPHYLSLTNSKFKEIGLGISINPANKKFYLTAHYGTEISNKPMLVCTK